MRIVSLLLLVFILGSLQGCFPVVAAGVGAGVVMAQDRRNTEVYIEDQKIESKAARLIDEQVKTVMHVNTTSFNYRVLITGEVPDEATKAKIEQIVSGIEKIRHLDNDLIVSSTSSLVSRSDDTLITSNVKLRFVDNKDFNGSHIKVVTENNTVYLMGLVNHAEADAATEVARTTKGVKQVVRMFEYLD
jgi:osmotically-inducible protein OsmY